MTIMWRRLVNDHHVRVPRDYVLHMREIDPDSVRRRKAHMLVLRRYYARGPNYVWHVDGYDKLKPCSSVFVAKYYLDTLRDFGLCPRLLRCDCGTENASSLYYNHFLDIITRTVCLV